MKTLGIQGIINFNPRSPDGERPERWALAHKYQNFNPRSPDGERRKNYRNNETEMWISIHAPRMGSDSIIVTPE